MGSWCVFCFLLQRILSPKYVISTRRNFTPPPCNLLITNTFVWLLGLVQRIRCSRFYPPAVFLPHTFRFTSVEPFVCKAPLKTITVLPCVHLDGFLRIMSLKKKGMQELSYMFFSLICFAVLFIVTGGMLCFSAIIFSLGIYYIVLLFCGSCLSCGIAGVKEYNRIFPLADLCGK